MRGNRSFGGKLVFQLLRSWPAVVAGDAAAACPPAAAGPQTRQPWGGVQTVVVQDLACPLPPSLPLLPSPPFLFPFFAGIHSICGAPGRTGKCRRRLQFPDKVSRTRNIFRLKRRNTGSVWGETQGPTCRNPKPSLEKTKSPLLAFRNILLDQNIPRHHL